MIKRGLILTVILIMLISNVIALDLSEFPSMFVKDGQADVLIVVGKSARAEDVLGAIDIVVMLQNELGGKKLQNIATLDNEVGSLDAHNTIVVGGPCANSAAAKLLGYPANCLEGFEVGKGYIKLYQWSNGKIALLVAGTVASDTRRTTYVLANYKDYMLNGTSVIVSGVSTNDLTIKRIK